MGEVDKGLQKLNGIPMVAHVLKRLAPQVGHLMINANRNFDIYEQFGVPVYADDLSGYAGPLAGLQTGLRRCTTSYLLTVPCDGPFLPTNLVERLWDGLVSQKAELAVAVTGLGSQQQAQPVFCLMQTALLPHLDKFLASGKRRVDGWYAPLKVAEVYFEDEMAFRNINTLEELHQSANKPNHLA